MANLLAVEGVKPDVKAIIGTAKKLNIHLPKTRSAAKLVPVLRAEFSRRLAGVPQDDWIRCIKCHEVTDDAPEIDMCPYCGDEGEAPEEAAAAAANESDYDGTSEEAIAGANGSAFEPIEASEVDEGTDVEDPKPVDISAADEDSDDDSVDEDSDDDSADEDSDDDSADEDSDDDSDALSPSDDDSDALSPSDDDSEAGYHPAVESASLEEEKRIIASASKDIRRSAYELGKSLKRVFDGELWQQEGHSSFRAFLKSVDVDSSMAYKLMDVVKQFSEQQVLEVGWTKLSIVAKLPVEERDEAVERARDTSRRQLAAGAEDDDDGPTNLDPLNDGTQSRGRPRKEDQEITLLTKVGGKPESYRFFDRATGKPVRKWHENTYGEVRLSNEVVMYLAMRVEKGEIRGFSTSFRRVELDEEVAAE